MRLHLTAARMDRRRVFNRRGRGTIPKLPGSNVSAIMPHVLRGLSIVKCRTHSIELSSHVSSSLFYPCHPALLQVPP